MPTVNGLADSSPPPEDYSDFPINRGADNDNDDGTKRATTMSLLAFLGVCQSAGLVAPPAARDPSTFGGSARGGGGLVEDVLGRRSGGKRPSGRGRGGGGGFGFVGGAGRTRKLDAGAEATTAAPDGSFPVSI